MMIFVKMSRRNQIKITNTKQPRPPLSILAKFLINIAEPLISFELTHTQRIFMLIVHYAALRSMIPQTQTTFVNVMLRLNTEVR
jgi:hypothetical protein